ncbi:MAG: non-reducing end alpha-L-arabinofuranosidase family hydrolase [Bacteroidota bacterium]
MKKRFTIPIVMVLLFSQTGCLKQGDVHYQQWFLVDTVLTSRPDHPLDNVAVKDPSIVFYDGNYHLFYTAKSVTFRGEEPQYSIACAYASAPTLDRLNGAERYCIDSIAGRVVIAPQIFCFEPQQLWYLIAHTSVRDGDLSVIKPIYMTNKDISDVSGWTKAKVIPTGKRDNTFWIDFWMICDDRMAYMFYGDQKGSVLRLESPLDKFPEGFASSEPEIALTESGDSPMPWRMFEAVHIYHVKSDDKYLALLEGAYQNPAVHYQIDSRNRFILGMVADSLNGAWRRIEAAEDQFLADANNLSYRDGSKTPFTQVSHPELIRSGCNQKMEIEDYKLRLFFQSFDGTQIPDTYNYNELPWKLMLMKNY